MTKLVLECEQLRKYSSGSEVERPKHELLQAKVRIKELWKDMCDQIRELDYALWERDNEPKSLKKQTGMKSAVTTLLATEQTDSYSPLLLISTEIPFCPIKLFRFFLNMYPLLLTSLPAMESQHHKSYLL